jgi:hypothetical protein
MQSDFDRFVSPSETLIDHITAAFWINLNRCSISKRQFVDVEGTIRAKLLIVATANDFSFHHLQSFPREI